MMRLFMVLLIVELGSRSFGASNAVTGVSGKTQAAATNDLVEMEFKRIMMADDEAQAEVDKWIKDNHAFAAKGAGISREQLNNRIFQRFETVRRSYEEFIKQHPDHARARVAYGSFLGDIHDEEGALHQLEKALELNSQDPAVYNNLANIYGHSGPVKKAFDFYAKAIELRPEEPVYYQNFGTTVFLFRQDAREHFQITEQEVFNKALELYSKAMKLDPTNFPLATDVAQTFYGIKPTRTEDALQAWTNAFKLASDDLEREGVQLHFARFKMTAGRYEEARQHLDAVTNAALDTVKQRLIRNLSTQEAEAKTNSPGAPKEAQPLTAPPGRPPG